MAMLSTQEWEMILVLDEGGVNIMEIVGLMLNEVISRPGWIVVSRSGWNVLAKFMIEKGGGLLLLLEAIRTTAR